MADNTAQNATDTLATDDITDGGVANGVKVERIKVGSGADGNFRDATPALGLPIASSFLEVSGSASANNADLVNVDAAGYRWVTIQVTTAVSGFLLFQGSNDNTNWANVYLSRADVVNTEPTWFSNGTSLWAGPLPCRYFRVRSNAWTSGTESVVTNFSVGPVIGLPPMVSRVIPMPATGSGWTPSFTSALSTTKVAVKASAAVLGGWAVYNPNTTIAYVQVFDVASASVTLGTTAPTYVIPVPPLSMANLELTCGIAHATAITVAATTTATGSTAPATGLPATILYK